MHALMKSEAGFDKGISEIKSKHNKHLANMEKTREE